MLEKEDKRISKSDGERETERRRKEVGRNRDREGDTEKGGGRLRWMKLAQRSSGLATELLVTV